MCFSSTKKNSFILVYKPERRSYERRSFFVPYTTRHEIYIFLIRMEEIRVFDFHRIFLGDGPGLFLLEIVFRTVVMYAYTIILLRFLGKRGLGQLSHLELAIIICFGSAVGDPMIGAEMPILHGMVAITTVALLQVGMEKFINRHRRIEKFVEGLPVCLVDGGEVKIDALHDENLSLADLFRALRNKEVMHLGEINKAFFETSGDITVLFQSPRHVKPGLCIIPRKDETTYNDTEEEDQAPPKAAEGYYSCISCGNTIYLKHQMKLHACDKCGNEKWAKSALPDD